MLVKSTTEDYLSFDSVWVWYNPHKKQYISHFSPTLMLSWCFVTPTQIQNISRVHKIMLFHDTPITPNVLHKICQRSKASLKIDGVTIPPYIDTHDKIWNFRFFENTTRIFCMVWKWASYVTMHIVRLDYYTSWAIMIKGNFIHMEIIHILCPYMVNTACWQSKRSI